MNSVIILCLFALASASPIQLAEDWYRGASPGHMTPSLYHRLTESEYQGK